MKSWPYDIPGIPGQLFARGDSPITREEIRAIVMDKLRLAKDDRLLDIGAGTGAVAIEAGRVLTAGQVWAVEERSERVALIAENCQRFGVDNITIITGTAPEVLANLPQVNRAFIGGSGNNLGEIINCLIPKFSPESRLVMTAVTLETLHRAIEILSQPPFKEFEGVAVNLAILKSLKDYHLFQPEHAIYILAASVN